MSVGVISPRGHVSGPCRTCSSDLRRRHNMLRKLKSQFGSKKNSDYTGMTRDRNLCSQRPGVPTRRSSVSGENNILTDLSDVPPPPYSLMPIAAPIVHAPAAPTASANNVADDPYAFLGSFDTIVLIDDSGSMAGSRWRETAEALEAITPICTEHDADGIDIYFLNHPDMRDHHRVNTPQKVREIFGTVRPCRSTPTGQRLNQLIKPYLRQYEASPDSTKPINIICITDGKPSDDLESPLIAAAKKLDKLDAPAWQVGVQFFQVGRDEEAKRHLKQLDDELALISGDDDLRDMIDTVPFLGAEGARLTGDGILKVVLGAVNRRLDRKRSRDLHR